MSARSNTRSVTNVRPNKPTIAKTERWLTAGGAGYKISDPSKLQFGKSYSEWVCDWFNWFISVDADSRNSGPVVFLRSYGLPDTSSVGSELDATGQGSELNVPPNMMSMQSNYSGMHLNLPNIRIGDNRLRIFDDQFVLVPIINSYWVKYDPSVNEDWGTMEEYTSIAINYGEEPPHKTQLTINDVPVDLGAAQDLRDFRINTSVFTAVVPDTDPGRSVKDFLGHPMPAGNYPALVQGYFVMISFEPDRTYWIHSWGEAPPDVRGPYFAELLYEIEVRHRDIKSAREGIRPAARPPASETVFNRILARKEAIGGLTTEEIKKFKDYFRDESKKDNIARKDITR
jgi:hypothetical protein